MDNSIWVWLIVGGAFALAILKTHAEHRAYAAAKEAYHAALAALADDPADTALRQDALRKGRALTAAGRRINPGAKTACERPRRGGHPQRSRRHPGGRFARTRGYRRRACQARRAASRGRADRPGR
ncbi:hypothetical protein [Thiocapsa sp.]|uniref:hypothetical protein n=1 Tax=Thiocapsa sp. TaxID=2024551 RepID=UPI001BD17FBA|nr:hypothetical protein [Thiocapsa sp.]